MQIKAGKEESYKGWQKAYAEGFYNQGILAFADRWASKMEGFIKGGTNLQDCADRCESEADTDGITGFMYGCAIKLLCDVWEYGDDLCKWWNRQNGQPDETFPTNPALVEVSEGTTAIEIRDIVKQIGKENGFITGTLKRDDSGDIIFTVDE